MGVGVHGFVDVGMAEDLLDHLGVDVHGEQEGRALRVVGPDVQLHATVPVKGSALYK